MESSLQGYSQTVFAFGQTGSGKTYSICGTDDLSSSTEGSERPVRGLLEEAAACCFEKASKSSSLSVKVDITCLEIYQEQVTDLLVEKKQVLPVRHNPKYGFYVQGLTQKQCETVQDYRGVLVKAFQRRRVASHSLNERSTRSHLMITIHLTTKSNTDNTDNRDEDVPTGLSTFGRMCFVDLAGSERLGDTKSKNSSAVIRAETGSINKSLFALGKVISMLGNARAKRSNLIIPFRDSKLTQLLMDSLQGKGKATMIACCSPVIDHCDITSSTLHYASLAQNVKSDPVILHDPQDQLVIDLRKTILELKAENKKLAVQLSQLTSDMPLSEPEKEREPETNLREIKEKSMVREQKVVQQKVVQQGKVSAPLKEESKKSSVRILKERSTIKRNAKKSANKAVPKALAQSPYGGDNGKLPPKIPRKQSAKKVKSKPTASKKPPRARKPEKRVLKDSLQMNIEALDVNASAEDFPDLAALEANFQAQMAQVQGKGEESASGGQLSGLDHSINAMADTVTSDSKDPQEEFEGDPEAVRWARRNPWFGNDYEMTEYAYEIHDYLVDRNIDPNSKQYYREIESRVREKFPDRMPKPTPKAKPRRASRSNRTVGSRLSQSIKSSLPRPDQTKKSITARSLEADMSLESSYSSDSLHNFKMSTPAKQQTTSKSIDFSYSSQRSTASGLSKDKSERQYIVEELRRIKQEAEEERRWIMNQISSTLSSYKL